jgi:hypothetical protein
MLCKEENTNHDLEKNTRETHTYFKKTILNLIKMFIKLPMASAKSI